MPAAPSTSTVVVVLSLLTATEAPPALLPLAEASATAELVTELAACRLRTPTTVALALSVKRTVALLAISDTATAASPAMLGSAVLGRASVPTVDAADNVAFPATVNAVLPPTFTAA